jgi:hypothetical protein
MFKKSDFYFCGTQDDQSTRDVKYLFRAYGYCCKDQYKGDSKVKNCNSDLCTPVSTARNSSAPYQALYMAFSVGMKTGENREGVCGAGSTLKAYNESKVVRFDEAGVIG